MQQGRRPCLGCGWNKSELLALVNIGFQYQNVLKINMGKRQQLSFLFQRVIGKPVGWMYPSFHASSRHTNNTTEKTTRHVNALAKRRLSCASWVASGLRSIKNPAVARQATMAKRNKAMAYVMSAIMKVCV